MRIVLGILVGCLGLGLVACSDDGGGTPTGALPCTGVSSLVTGCTPGAGGTPGTDTPATPQNQLTATPGATINPSTLAAQADLYMYAGWYETTANGKTAEAYGLWEYPEEGGFQVSRTYLAEEVDPATRTTAQFTSRVDGWYDGQRRPVEQRNYIDCAGQKLNTRMAYGYNESGQAVTFTLDEYDAHKTGAFSGRMHTIATYDASGQVNETWMYGYDQTRQLTGKIHGVYERAGGTTTLQVTQYDAAGKIRGESSQVVDEQVGGEGDPVSVQSGAGWTVFVNQQARGSCTVLAATGAESILIECRWDGLVGRQLWLNRAGIAARRAARGASGVCGTPIAPLFEELGRP